MNKSFKKDAAYLVAGMGACKIASKGIPISNKSAQNALCFVAVPVIDMVRDYFDLEYGYVCSSFFLGYLMPAKVFRGLVFLKNAYRVGLDQADSRTDMSVIAEDVRDEGHYFNTRYTTVPHHTEAWNGVRDGIHRGEQEWASLKQGGCFGAGIAGAVYGKKWYDQAVDKVSELLFESPDKNYYTYFGDE